MPPSTQGPNTKRLHQIKSSCPREGRRVMLPGDIQVVSALHSRPVRSTPNNTDRHLTSHYHNDSFHRWTHQWIQDFFQIYRRSVSVSLWKNIYGFDKVSMGKSPPTLQGHTICGGEVRLSRLNFRHAFESLFGLCSFPRKEALRSFHQRTAVGNPLEIEAISRLVTKTSLRFSCIRLLDFF